MTWFLRIRNVIARAQESEASSLSDLRSRSEKMAERGQISPIFWSIVVPIDQKIGEIWTAQAFLQPIPLSPTGC